MKKYYKLIATDLNKEQKLNNDPKAIQQINFPGNLVEDNATMLYIHEEAKKKKKKKKKKIFTSNRERIVVSFCFKIISI